MSDQLASEVARLKERIQQLLKRVPTSVCQGSFDRSVRYKKTAVLARKRADMKSGKYADLHQSCNELESFESAAWPTPLPLPTTESAT